MAGEFLKIRDSIGLIKDVIERAALMAHEVKEDFVLQLERAAADNDFCRVNALATLDVHNAEIKSEILLSLLDDTTAALNELDFNVSAMSEAVKDSETPKHDCNAPTEEEILRAIVDDHLRSITNFVDVIESKPDCIHKIIQLESAAKALATDGSITVCQEADPLN